MKLLFLLLFSLLTEKAYGASCCAANTSVPNLMIMPSTWQQTFTVGNSRVIGDVNPKGQSTFRRTNNKEQTTLARADLAYQWTDLYQTGLSVKYQNKERQVDNDEAKNSGWSDLNFFHA